MTPNDKPEEENISSSNAFSNYIHEMFHLPWNDIAREYLDLPGFGFEPTWSMSRSAKEQLSCFFTRFAAELTAEGLNPLSLEDEVNVLQGRVSDLSEEVAQKNALLATLRQVLLDGDGWGGHSTEELVDMGESIVENYDPISTALYVPSAPTATVMGKELFKEWQEELFKEAERASQERKGRRPTSD